MSVNKSTAQFAKSKPPSAKSEISTGINSRQRSHIQSLHQVKDTKIQLSKNESGVKTQQLYTIIQTFYTTLCDLPLEKLISSKQPEFWISEQENTLQELERKLNATKNKNQEYYRWKLKSVGNILINIRDNLNMLSRINNLKNYSSGAESSNYYSRGGSSQNSEAKDLKLGDFAAENAKIQEMLSYDHYVINGNEKRKENMPKLSQLMAHTIHSDSEQSFNEQQLKITKSEVIPKDVSRRNRTGQNINCLNNPQMPQNSCKFAYKRPAVELKDKTLAKIQNANPSSSQRTLSNFNLEGRERRFLQDRALYTQQITCEQTRRSEALEDIKKSEVKSRFEDTLTHNKERQTQYVELIKQLRMQLLGKDKQIERLLINQQQVEQSIEILQSREKEKAKEVMFLKENLANQAREKENLQSEIRRLQIQSQDLKETVRLQRERNKKEEKERQKMKQKIQQYILEKQQFNQEIQKIKDQCKTYKKNERIMKEKLQIYTKKYFNIYRQLQESRQDYNLLMKEFDKMPRIKTVSMYEQIKQIVQHHKERIYNQQ